MPRTPRYKNDRSLVRARFLAEVGKHKLTILHDDGLYRHLYVGQPGTGIWSWSVVTWPGHIAVTGDIGEGYTFTRLEDMFEFFRRNPNQLDTINSDYWAEKLVRRDGAQVYSQEKFQDNVDDVVDDWCATLSKKDRKALRAAVQEEIHDQIEGYYATDYRTVEQFRFRDSTGYEHYFADFWDYSANVHDSGLLRAMHAIVRAIHMYDEQKAVTA